MSAGQAADGRLPPGAMVAGYRIEARIGRGGMATVYRAHDERLGRTVALKVMVPALAADQEFRARFIRESRVAAATDHPHIIPVYEAGEGNGLLFIAMRFVRGGDLRWHLSQSGQLAPEVVADIVSQIASALDAAHKRGLVHRDIKPGNLLLDVGSDTGEPDHVYLSDFGLSKDSISVGTMTALTSTGQVLGTLDYMAPEQIEGKPIDGRADQYGLACTAYELLCGTPPFGDHPSTALMRAHRTDTPPPISSRRPRLPRGIDLVFARALAKAPSSRYPNCRDFAAALRAVCGLEQYRSGLQFTPRYRSDPKLAAALAGPESPSRQWPPVGPEPARHQPPATPASPARHQPPATPASPARHQPPATPASPAPHQPPATPASPAPHQRPPSPAAPARQVAPARPQAPARQRPPASPAPAGSPRPFTPTGPTVPPAAAATTIRRRDLPPKPGSPAPAQPAPAQPAQARPKPIPPASPGPSPAHADRTEVDWDALGQDRPTVSPPARQPSRQPPPSPPHPAPGAAAAPGTAATPDPEPDTPKRRWLPRRDQQ